MAAKLVRRGGIFSSIDLNQYGLQEVPVQHRTAVKKQVGEFLVAQIKRSARNTESPVAGERWKVALSKDYAKEKRAAGGGSQANLRLTGSLMNSLTHKSGKGGEVLVGNTTGRGPDGRPNDRKSIGHNHFEPGAKSPRRRFLPGDGQNFKDKIDKGVRDIVEANKTFDLGEVGLDNIGQLTETVASTYQQDLLALVANQNIEDLL